MKKAILAILIFSILSIIALSGCSTNTGKATAQQARTEIIIGVPLATTGSASSYGNEMLQGIEVAIEELNNSQAEFFLKPIFEDTQSDSKQAVTSVKKLLEVDNARIIIGLTRSAEVLSAAPLIEKKKAILLTTLASAEEISSAGDYIFRNRETGILHGEKIAQFFRSKKVQNAGIISSTAANSAGYLKGFSKKFKELGGTIVQTVEYAENSQDLKNEVLKVLEKNPEAIYLVPTLDKDAILVLKEIKETGYSGLIASLPIDTKAFTQAASEMKIDGLVISSPFFNSENGTGAEFSRKVQAKFGKEARATFVSANSYDAVQIISKAVKSCGSPDTECIKKFLYSLKNYPGTGGLTSFDSKGDVIKPISIKAFKNGKFQVLQQQQ